MATAEYDLSILARYLRDQRDALLATWRKAIRNDPSMTTGTALPRAQLDDHVPALLRTFERRLDPAVEEGANEQSLEAAAHGLHRWQQGYDLREVARELGCLNQCMVAMLDSSSLADTGVSHDALAQARHFWAELCSIGIGESIAQYYRLQQAEAESHVRDLEQALFAVQELEKQRAELWHQVAHDLRGNVGVVANVAAGLTAAAATEAHRSAFLEMLERNVTSLQHLLDDVTSLARLQAGKEVRTIQTFDAAKTLSDLCSGLQAYAQMRGLTLTTTGPAPFVVEGDPLKVRRVAQNLVLNALKYTREGSVVVGWGASESNDFKRWLLWVADTGPGFNLGPGSPIAGALGEATQLSQQADDDAKSGKVTLVDKYAIEDPETQTQQPGEGIGLSIVKRLAELLDASIEVESSHLSGTTFRVLFPR